MRSASAASQWVLAACSLLLMATCARAEAGKLDAARIEKLTGAKGKMDEREGVFKVSVPRSDLSVTAGGVKMTPPMGRAALDTQGKEPAAR